MSRLLEIYDIECLSNCFTYTGYCPKENKYYQFVIWSKRNDLEALYEHLTRGIYQVGFNNEGYDYPVLHHIINHYHEYKYLSGLELAQLIYRKSQEIIDMQFSAIADKNKYIPQLDLYLIHHYDNRALATSLKHIEVSLRLENVEDMPIHHTEWITSQEQIDLILGYNKNDVYATYKLYLLTKGETDHPLYKGKDMLALRKDIMNKFKIPCLNYNDVKIGDELNKKKYLERNPGVKLQKGGTKRTHVELKNCILPNIQFKSPELQSFLNTIKQKVVMIDDNGSLEKYSVDINYKGLPLTFGLGGIHSIDPPRTIIPLEDEKLEDRDCRSMHPNTILKYQLFPQHLGISWLENYQWLYDERAVNKKLSKDESVELALRKASESIQEAFKLGLNGGGFGKTGEYNSWACDYQTMLTVTVSNQLFLMMLAEDYRDHDIDVKSANTDGLLILFKRSQQEIIDNIDRKWMEVSKHFLEYTEYTKFIQTSVNDYIAQTPDGKCKFKGDFLIDRQLHKNPSMIIVPIALKEYFINKIPIEKTIKNHTNIYDFCLMLRTNKNYKAELHYVKDQKATIDVLSKTIRYYCSVKGGYLYKRYAPEYTEEERGKLSLKELKRIDKLTGVNVKQQITLFNKYVEKSWNDYDIDYNFYINEAKKIINKVEINTQQLSLF